MDRTVVLNIVAQQEVCAGERLPGADPGVFMAIRDQNQTVCSFLYTSITGSCVEI